MWKNKIHKMYFILFFEVINMIYLIITLSLIIIVMFSKIQIRFYLNNKDYKVTLIFLYVIKIGINAKASKRIKTLNIKTSSIKLKDKIKITLIIVKDSLKKLEYIIGKVIFNLNIDCTYYILGPDKTAMIYGIANTIIYNVENIFHIFFKEYNSNLNIKPDFQSKNNNIRINGNISVRIIHLLILLFKLLPIIFRYKKLTKSKGGEVNGSSNRGVNENYDG